MALEKQFSIFVQNKVGSLGQLCTALSKDGVNIKALSIVDDLDWGIVRLIVDDPDRMKEILHKLGLMYGENQVLTIQLENHPGALATLADTLSKKKINIDQAFASVSGESCLLILSTTDDKKANSILS